MFMVEVTLMAAVMLRVLKVVDMVLMQILKVVKPTAVKAEAVLKAVKVMAGMYKVEVMERTMPMAQILKRVSKIL